jgi:hypothetical protein
MKSEVWMVWIMSMMILYAFQAVRLGRGRSDVNPNTRVPQTHPQLTTQMKRRYRRAFEISDFRPFLSTDHYIHAT